MLNESFFRVLGQTEMLHISLVNSINEMNAQHFNRKTFFYFTIFQMFLNMFSVCFQMFKRSYITNTFLIYLLFFTKTNSSQTSKKKLNHLTIFCKSMLLLSNNIVLPLDLPQLTNKFFEQ